MIWVRAGKPITTRDLGGHLAVIAAGSDVRVSHSGDLRGGGHDGVWRVTPNGQRTLVLDLAGDARPGTVSVWYSADGEELLSHRAPTVAASDGTTLWIGEPWIGEPWIGEPWIGEPWIGEPWIGEPWIGEPWIGEPWIGEHELWDVQTDPVGTLTLVDLATGRAGVPVRVAGQVDDLGWAFGRLWRSGFVRSRQETALTVIAPASRHIAEVDFTDADVRPYLPRREARPALDYDDELDRLIGELRPGGPLVDEDFRLLDLALDRATPAVRITFSGRPSLTSALSTSSRSRSRRSPRRWPAMCRSSSPRRSAPAWCSGPSESIATGSCCSGLDDTRLREDPNCCSGRVRG